MDENSRTKKPPYRASPLNSYAAFGEYCFWVLVLVLVPLWLAGGAGPTVELGDVVAHVSFALSFGIGTLILAATDSFLSLPTGRTALLVVLLWQGWPLMLVYALAAFAFFCMPILIAHLARNLWRRSMAKRIERQDEKATPTLEAAGRCAAPGMFYAITGTFCALVEAVAALVWFANRTIGWHEHWPDMFLLLFATLLTPALGSIALLQFRRNAAVFWMRHLRSRVN